MENSEYQNIYEQESSYWWYLTLHHLIKKYLLSKKVKKSNILLDAGCGTGRLLEVLSPLVTAEGIDFSGKAVNLARKRGLKQVTTADLNIWEAPNEQYDIITSLDVLYHSGIKNDLVVLNKFYRALKPGGILVLNLAAFESLRRSHDQIVQTRKRYRKKPLCLDLKEIGFTIDKAFYRLPLIYLYIKIQKLFSSSSKQEAVSDLQQLPGWLNKLLFTYGKLENHYLLNGIGFPVGSSVFIVAHKPQN